MASYRKHTGGVKEFGHPGFDLKDTDSSREFKKSLLLGYFLKDPYDAQTKQKLQKYLPFHKLSLRVFSKGKQTKYSLKINYIDENQKSRLLVEEKNLRNEYEIELPGGDYLIITSIKSFLLFTKSKKLRLELNKNIEKKISF